MPVVQVRFFANDRLDMCVAEVASTATETMQRFVAQFEAAAGEVESVWLDTICLHRGVLTLADLLVPV